MLAALTSTPAQGVKSTIDFLVHRMLMSHGFDIKVVHCLGSAGVLRSLSQLTHASTPGLQYEYQGFIVYLLFLRIIPYSTRKHTVLEIKSQILVLYIVFFFYHSYRQYIY